MEGTQLEMMWISALESWRRTGQWPVSGRMLYCGFEQVSAENVDPLQLRPPLALRTPVQEK